MPVEINSAKLEKACKKYNELQRNMYKIDLSHMTVKNRNFYYSQMRRALQNVYAEMQFQATLLLGDHDGGKR
jgi:hypothetical protein